MRDDIRKRIKAVRRGEIPKGYTVDNHQLHPNEWNYEKIGNYLIAYDKYSNDTEQYMLATSSRQGLLPQTEYYTDQRYDETAGGFHVVPEGYVTYRHMSDDDVFKFNVNRFGTPVLVSPEYPVFTTKPELNQNLLIEYLNGANEFRTFCRAQKKGSTRTRMYFSRLGEFMMPIPPVPEQEKIADILSACDQVIDLKQKRVEELKRLKKSCLAKMFPRNGADVPKLRFPGFTDYWKQCKLGDIARITMGQSPDGATYSEIPSDYILIQGNADLQDGWVVPRVWTTQITKKAEAGDLIMSVRAPAGTVGKTAYNAVIGRGVAAIKGNEYIYQLLVKMDSDGFWKKYSAGSTFESLNSEDIKKATIFIPSSEEQYNIGDYFQKLDTFIALCKRELEAEQQKKKALMQLLLTGLVRVKV